MNLQELQTKKMELANAAGEILKRSEADGRLMTGDENSKFDALHTELEQVNGQMARMIKQDELSKSAGETRTASTNQPGETRTIVRPTAAAARAGDVDLALRGWLLTGSENGDASISEEHREAARRCGVNLASKSLSLRLGHPLRSLDARDVEAWEKRAPMGVASGSIGLYSAPDSPMGALERALLAFGGMRQVATVFRTESGTDMPFPTSDDTSNKGALLAENTQVSEVDITFGQLVLNSFKYSSKLVLVATELLQDSAVNVPEMIGSALGERIGRIQNDHFTTGTGTGQPNGVVTAATSSSITTSAATTVTYDNIVDLIHKVDPAYRTNSRFMFHDGGLKLLKKIKVLQYSGDTVGVPLWQPSLVAGQPDLIHGYPFVINQSVATPASGTKSFLFGDFSKYLIRDVREVRLVRFDERYADYDQVGFTAFARGDGDLKDAGTHPVYYMTQGA